MKNKKLIIVILVAITFLFLLKKVQSKNLNNNVFNGKKIIIGDSHAVGIAKATKGVYYDKNLAVGGWFLSNLMKALNNYSVNKDISHVFISIGTNGQFQSVDKIEDLINLVKEKFPNAKIYAYKGSYGWSGTRTPNEVLNRLTAYYKRFEKVGVTMLKNGLLYFKDGGQAHTTSTPQSKAIIKEIEEIIK